MAPKRAGGEPFTQGGRPYREDPSSDKAAARVLQQLVDHLPQGIKRLQPGAAHPGLLAGLLAPPLQSEPTPMEHQLKVAVAATAEIESGLGVAAMEGIHGASVKDEWSSSSLVPTGFFVPLAAVVISQGPLP